MDRLRGHLNNEQGLTLAELLVALAVSVIVLGGAFTVFSGSLGIYGSASGQVEAQRDGRLAMFQMTRYARMAETIILAGDYELKVTCDINDDGAWNHIYFFLQNDELHYSVDDSEPIVLARHIRNQEAAIPIFTYYDIEHDPLSEEDVRKTNTQKISVTLEIKDDNHGSSDSYRLESMVGLRNYE